MHLLRLLKEAKKLGMGALSVTGWPMQAAEAERRVLEAAKRARAEVEAQLAEKDPEALGLDASGRRLLAQSGVMAQELVLHIEVRQCLLNWSTGALK